MKNNRVFIVTFIFLAAMLNTGLAQEFSKAGPGSLIATVDTNCNPLTTQFSIGKDFLAVQIQMVSFNGGNDCAQGRPVDEKGFTIQNESGAEIYKWFQYQNNPALEPLGPLNALSISSGTYTLKVNGGRDAQVILRFNIINLTQQGAAPIIDTDKDGVPDIWDRCPNTPPNSFVDNFGCPGQTQLNDADRDGVIDQWDMEPNTPPNSYVNRNGQRQMTTPTQQPISTQPMPTQPSQPVAGIGGSAPWEIWLGRWEVVSTYSGCPAANTLPWWFEVVPVQKGYEVRVQSGSKSRIDLLSDQNLEFLVQDGTKTQIKLWLTSTGQCEGMAVHPKNVPECQQATIVGQKR